jgi:hypothetical protein
MKIKSIATKGADLPEYFFKLGNFAFPTSDYQLNIGDVYTVYGMSLYQHVLDYLIFPSNLSDPGWYPAPFFEVIDPSVPKGWYFAHFGYQDEKLKKIPLGALWGYYELVFREDGFQHYEGLIDCDPVEIEIFLRRKKEIDEQS